MGDILSLSLSLSYSLILFVPVIPASLATFPQLLFSPFFYLLHHPSANLLTSSSLVFISSFLNLIPTVHLAIFPASSFMPFFFPPLCIHFQRLRLFNNQRGNTADKKQEKIPASFFISLTSSCAIPFCPFSSFQQLKR